MKFLGYSNFDKICTFTNFVDVWYAYYDLLDINFEEGFSCESSGSSPDTIICDKTSLGFRWEFLMSLVGRDPVPEIPIRRFR